MATKIAVVVGSIRKDSFNRQVAEAITKLASEGVEFNFVRIDDLPLYNQDSDASPPELMTRLRNDIKAADGVLFVTPEYNRSIPGVLKNAIDIASRPWGHSVWAKKPVGIIGVSVGVIGTALAQAHLRNIVNYLDMPLYTGSEIYLAWKDGLVVDGEIGADSKEFLQGYMTGLVEWIKTH